MNILPKKYSEFKEKQYWNKFFNQLKNTNQQFFQWYGNYNDFKSTLKTIFKQISQVQSKQIKIFHIGCGKSTFGEDIQCDYPEYEIINTDYSEQIISDMIKRSKQLKLKCTYETCDMLQPLHEKYLNRFNIVLDKGTLDAILPEDQQNNIAKIKHVFFKNIEECLKKQQNGSYMIISMLQPFVLRTVLQHFFKKQNFVVQIYQSHIKNSKMQPFLLNITRKQDVKQAMPQISLKLLSKQQVKLHSIQQTIIKISQIQQSIDYSQRAKQIVPNQHLIFNISNKANPQKNRYTLQIIDNIEQNILKNKNTCSIFIVPQGKQPNFLFSTPKGLKQFIQQLNTNRIIIVKLVIGNIFKSLAQVKTQLNGVIGQFIQQGCDIKDVPYLTDADQLGVRKYVYQDNALYIQETMSNGDAFRRVILKNNQSLIQTQYKLIQKSVKDASRQSIKALQQKTSIFAKKKGYVTAIDSQFLDDGYCRIIVNGVQRLFNDYKSIKDIKFLVLGGGGYALPTFIYQNYEQSSTIDIVQIQKSLCQEQVFPYFQIDHHVKSQKFKIINQDAYKFVMNKKQNQKQNYDCIIVDISGDQEKGDSLPPQLFFSKQFIESCYQLLSNEGVLVVNVIKKGFFKNQLPSLLQTKLFYPVYINVQEEDQQMKKEQNQEQQEDLCVIFLCKRKPVVQKVANEEFVIIKEQELALSQLKGKFNNLLGYEWEKETNFKMIYPKIQKNQKNQYKLCIYQNLKVVIQASQGKKKHKKKK